MNNDESITTREAMSALADGQLRGEPFARAMAALAAGDEAGDTWRTYHQIGDALRADVVAGSNSHDLAFLATFRQRLAAEPAALTLGQAEGAAETVKAPVLARQFDPRREAANDGVWRWKMVAGVASVAVIGVLAWNVVGGPATNNAAVLAQQGQAARSVAAAPSATTVRVITPQGVLVRDRQLDELLAAHKQLGSTSALQPSTGFLRNATFEAADR